MKSGKKSYKRIIPAREEDSLIHKPDSSLRNNGNPLGSSIKSIQQNKIVVSVDKVVKKFPIYHQKYSSLKEELFNTFRKSKVEMLTALNKVTFNVEQGEFFGVIGRNGGGKSTLLKMLSGVYLADSGNITIDGNISSFLELGVGMNPDLTARENIFICGLVLGLTLDEIKSKFDDIINFSELGNFVDVKVKNFSSGMYVRLAFSIAIYAHNNDILFIDEVLAVGDDNFKLKCVEEFRSIKENKNKTVVFVSHDLYSIERFCDRVMVMEKGMVKFIGTSYDAIEVYKEILLKNKEI
ncbi:MAG: ABC-typepolysaccharide/polyolphosphate transport system, ATPase component [Ignavibacteria bacterium]|nr:ABC-typepolysaccharide/polyolphosphate transport system, ATPase component [Ignavibacteria bacterium]